MAQAVETCADHGARLAPGASPPAGGDGSAGRDPTADAWRRSFFELPYLRDGLLAYGAIVETFETACTWSSFPSLHAAVKTAVRTTPEAVAAARGQNSC